MSFLHAIDVCFKGKKTKKKLRTTGRLSGCQLLSYLSEKHGDNVKLKERKLDLEERKLKIEEDRVQIEKAKWEALMRTNNNNEKDKLYLS